MQKGMVQGYLMYDFSNIAGLDQYLNCFSLCVTVSYWVQMKETHPF